VAKVSSGTKAERFGFIELHGSELGVRYLCDWLDVSHQGFYKWQKRTESNRTKENRILASKIEKIFIDNDGNYGSPRVYAALRAQGIQVNHKRVERIMRDSGLVGKAAKLYRRHAPPEREYLKYPNLRLNMPAPSKVNEQWVGDVTYLHVNGQWKYLAVVMDLYSRRILGWSLGTNRQATLTRRALLKALSHRKVEEGLIFHTDRGVEYGANLIQDELAKAGIESSMNRPKSITDNIHMESFFRSLKTECYHGLSFKNESELRIALSYYLDIYYNTSRIHTSIGNMAPVQFERMAA